MVPTRSSSVCADSISVRARDRAAAGTCAASATADTLFQMGSEEAREVPEEEEHRGRLELTWTNKELCLLADEDGSYSWVPPTDYRVAEVRLLDDAGTVGETYADRSRARDNLLIRGDALNALTSLGELPEFAREYAGQVKLAYLDPPFNTEQSFLHYDDALEHSVWLTMMRDRLEQIQKLLAPEGSVWVHCDDSEQAYLKVMMDELFGDDSFVATVIWEKPDIANGCSQLLRPPRLHPRLRPDRRLPTIAKKTTAPEHTTSTDDEGQPYYLSPCEPMGGQGGTREEPTLYFALEAPDGTKVIQAQRRRRWGLAWNEERFEREEEQIDGSRALAADPLLSDLSRRQGPAAGNDLAAYRSRLQPDHEAADQRSLPR